MIDPGHAVVSEEDDYCRIPYFDLLEDALDLGTVPFTDRGSRILVGLSERADANIEKPRQTIAAGLAVRMAERWSHLEAKLGNHRTRRPLIEGLRPIDRSGHPLPFRLVTWPHRLLLHTPAGDYDIFFADRQTLYLRCPNSECGLALSIMAESFKGDERGGIVDNPRLLAITSGDLNGNLRVTGTIGDRLSLVLYNRDDTGGVWAINIPEGAECSRSVLPPEAAIKAVEREWLAWFEAVPRVNRQYWRQYYLAWTILRTGLLSPMGYLKREALAPSKTHYVGVWHWDAYFHALAYRHVDRRLAQDQILALLDHQMDNGFIPDVVHDEGLIVREDGPGGRDLTKPPLIGWAALKLFEHGLGGDFLRTIYEPLVRWNNWWLERCDDDQDGIAQYNHPFSSGLDDSPLWDAGTPVESPDLSTYLCIHMQSLAAIARIIGRCEDAEMWDVRARDLVRRMNAHFYDASAGVFWAMKDHRRIQVLTPFNLLPIWTGRLATRQVRTVVANITRSSTFWTRFGIPTVAMSDRCFDPNRMWRGPIWINVNYMVIGALSRAGYHDLSATLADRTIDLVMQSGIAEYFNPIAGTAPARAAPAFGWSAALFVDLLIRRTKESRAPAGHSARYQEAALV